MPTKAAKLLISLGFRDAGYERGLKKARNETKRTKRAIDRLSPSISGLTVAAGAAATAMAGIFVGRKLFQAGKKAVDLFSDQQDAVEGLRAALNATGKAGVANLDMITDSAAELQKVTRAADEELIDATATLAQLAPALNARELADAQSAILGIADTFLKGNIANAAVLVGKSIGSSTNALVRYGVEIDTAASQSDKLNQLLQSTGTFFEVSQAKAQTYAGQIQQLKNFFGDMGETIGESLLPPLQDFSQFLLDSRDDIKRFTDAFADGLGEMSEDVQTFVRALSVDLGLAFGQLGVLIGSKMAQGMLAGLAGGLRAFESDVFGPLATGPFGAAFAGLSDALDGFADRAAAGAQRAADAINILAGASASAKQEMQRLFDQGVALAGLARGDLSAAAELFGSAAGGAGGGTGGGAAGGAGTDGKIPARPDAGFTDRLLLDRDISAPVQTGPALDVAGGLQLSMPPFNVEELDTGTVRMEEKLEEFGKSATRTMQGIGEDLVFGLINGTLSVGDILKKAVLRLASSFILGPLTGILGIGSPSKVTAGFGKNIGEGFVRGMDSMQGAVASAADRLAMAAIPIPAVATAGTPQPAAVRSIRPETPPLNIQVEASFDAHKEARSAGGQVFIREGARTARQQGARF